MAALSVLQLGRDVLWLWRVSRSLTSSELRIINYSCCDSLYLLGTRRNSFLSSLFLCIICYWIAYIKVTDFASEHYECIYQSSSGLFRTECVCVCLVVLEEKVTSTARYILTKHWNVIKHNLVFFSFNNIRPYIESITSWMGLRNIFFFHFYFVFFTLKNISKFFPYPHAPVMMYKDESCQKNRSQVCVVQKTGKGGAHINLNVAPTLSWQQNPLEDIMFHSHHQQNWNIIFFRIASKLKHCFLKNTHNPMLYLKNTGQGQLFKCSSLTKSCGTSREVLEKEHIVNLYINSPWNWHVFF